MPWRLAGACAASTVTPPTKTLANPIPSSGAMSTSATGSTASAASRARRANASEPTTTRRSVPNRPAIRGNANMYGTSMAAPTAHAMPTRPGLPPSATTWME